MKQLTFLLFILTISTMLTGKNASAGNREINGLIFGSGAGAIVGQALGRDLESTIIGATVGGVLGVIVNQGSGHRPARHTRETNVSYNHAPVYRYDTVNSRRRPHSTNVGRKPHYSRPGRVCKDVTTYRRDHRGEYQTVTTSCRKAPRRNNNHRNRQYPDRLFR